MFNRSQNLSPPLEGGGGRKIRTTTLSIKKDTLPPIKQLYACLETHHQNLLTAELAEYEETTKGEWLKYIPSVGVTYTINNQPRPSVSFSTSTIYQARKNKQLRAAKRNAIQQASAVALQVAKSKLASLVADYENATSRLQLAYRIHEIDKDLFEIDKVKYEQLEKAPSEWLKIQRAFLIKEQELGERERELGVLRNEVLRLTKCSPLD